MTVIVINEDNHGLIGIAKDFDSAINFLLQDHWLNTDIEIYDYDTESFKTLKELKISIDDIRKMSLEDFNELFDGYFNLGVDKVWGM